MNPAQFYTQQKTQQFQSSLSSWENQVRSARDFETMLRLSTFPPNADSLIRSLSTTRQALHQSKRRVETHLKRKLDQGIQDKDKAKLYRMACGHWPEIARHLHP